MRLWARAVVTTQCGAGPHLIAEGEPLQLIEIEGMKRRLVRCAACAWGEPPPDLPLKPPMRATAPMKPLAKLAVDFKMKQAG